MIADHVRLRSCRCYESRIPEPVFSLSLRALWMPVRTALDYQHSGAFGNRGKSMCNDLLHVFRIHTSSVRVEQPAVQTSAAGIFGCRACKGISAEKMFGRASGVG